MRFFWNILERVYPPPTRLRELADLRLPAQVATSDALRSVAREYVDAVTYCLRCDLVLHRVGTTELRNMAGHTGWLLHNGTLRGLGHIVHDGAPWPIRVPMREFGLPLPQRYDVAAVMLIEDCEFEAFYESSYTGSIAGSIAGKVSGKVQEVRVSVIIGHPEGLNGMPRLKFIETTHMTRPKTDQDCLGPRTQKVFEKAIGLSIRRCIDQAMSLSVAPVFDNVLSRVAYPDLTNVRQ